MDISPHNFVTPDQILADVLKVVNDSGHKTNTKGWYISQMQQALEELSFDTFFDVRYDTFDVPENLRLEMPKGSFNLRRVHLLSGDACTIENSVPVYRKRDFINGKSGNGYAADDHWDNSHDPFHKKRSTRHSNNRSATNNIRSTEFSTYNQLYYFSIQNGLLMLSESCRRFPKIMLEFNGVMTDIGDQPVIPQFFRQAVKDWVIVKALGEKMTETIGTIDYNHWAGMYNRYNESLNRPYEGSWAKAEYRAKQLNAKDRRDYKEYFTRLNH